MSKNYGIMNLLKPPGMTSFDAVNWLKNNFNVRKAGHTGTLDPLATGVLPICINKGTKIIPFLPEKIKEYQCEIELGLETTTHDREGEITEKNKNWKNLDSDNIEAVLKEFSGKIKQIPPMYSAVKKNGKRLYEFAREGKEVERDPREVRIKNITITLLKPPLLHLKISCSSGTYIRALARDIGRSLNCGGVLNFLIRTASGPFKINDALTPGDLKTEEDFYSSLISLTAPLNFPELTVKNSSLEKAVNGAQLTSNDFINPEKIEGKNIDNDKKKFIVRSQDNMFISVSSLKRCKKGIFVQPEKVFNLK